MITPSHIKSIMPTISNHYHLGIRCNSCHKIYELYVPADGFTSWRNGALIQHALPGLSADERELLISGTCSSCSDELFSEKD